MGCTGAEKAYGSAEAVGVALEMEDSDSDSGTGAGEGVGEGVSMRGSDEVLYTGVGVVV